MPNVKINITYEIRTSVGYVLDIFDSVELVKKKKNEYLNTDQYWVQQKIKIVKITSTEEELQ